MPQIFPFLDDDDSITMKGARKALPVLVRQAKVGNQIFYADLATEIEFKNNRLGNLLGKIGDALEKLSNEWEYGEIPKIQSLVVNQQTGQPGEGFDQFMSESNVKDFKSLSSFEKKKHVEGFQAKSYAYSKWNEVLSALGLISAPISLEIQNSIERATLQSRGYGGGGEGEKHKKLKLLIKNNPNLVGVNHSKLSSEVEKNLPSGDSVDVFFENSKNAIGVEVKSTISDENDITRGLFQCVKYLAVMNASSGFLGDEKNIRVLLALGGEFPQELIPLKNSLNVEVIDNLEKYDA